MLDPDARSRVIAAVATGSHSECCHCQSGARPGGEVRPLRLVLGPAAG